MSYVKIGVGGPVGSGKTALIERLTREMSKEYSICVVTNDIYTKEDAEFLTKNSCLPADRIVGVETGGCPHTAIREDCSMNLEAVDEMKKVYDMNGKKFPDVEYNFIYDVASFLNYYAYAFSLAGLARITGVNQGQLSHYVTGRRKPSKTTVEKIEKSLHAFANEIGEIKFV